MITSVTSNSINYSIRKLSFTLLLVAVNGNTILSNHYEHMLMLYHNCNHCTVPTSQSEITVMQSDDNQPRQDDESSQVEHTNGSYVCGILCVVAMTLKEH